MEYFVLKQLKETKYIFRISLARQWILWGIMDLTIKYKLGKLTKQYINVNVCRNKWNQQLGHRDLWNRKLLRWSSK